MLAIKHKSTIETVVYMMVTEVYITVTEVYATATNTYLHQVFRFSSNESSIKSYAWLKKINIYSLYEIVLNMKSISMDN